MQPSDVPDLGSRRAASVPVAGSPVAPADSPAVDNLPVPVRPKARRASRPETRPASQPGSRPDSRSEARPGSRPVPPARPTADVTAVLVAHDGAAWLPEALTALAASRLQPARSVGVDTGSTDGSVALLERAVSTVVQLPRDTGYGAAVTAGLQALAEPSAWVWLLHDDCAVSPDALEALLAHAAQSPSAAVLGPKVHDWYDPRLLVEVGLSTDGAGHRETGLERREYDQGQHDGPRDVLAVGTAGALVRRDVWDQLGGLDPLLPLFRDDLDLGWRVHAAGHRVVVVPRAVVRHVRAATTGRRTPGPETGRATGVDRRNAVFVLLAHATPLRLGGLLPALLLATVARVLGLLLTRQVGAAADELRAVAVLRHGTALREARRRRATTRTVPTREFRALFVSRSVRVQSRIGQVGDVLLRGAQIGDDPHGALGSGPEQGELPNARPGLLRRVLTRPGVLLVLALLVVALVAERHVLPFGGRLSGGQLLPAPGGARDLWRSYTSGWHPTTVGTASPAPPSTAVLALVATVLLGKAWLAVDVLLLLSVPLSGAVAYGVACRLVTVRLLRVWVAASWALLPVATGAVASGRLDVAVLQVGLPALALAVVRLAGRDDWGGWRAWASGLALAVLVAFAPLLWPVAGTVLLLGAVVRAVQGVRGGQVSRLRQAASLALVATVPLPALLPWSLQVFAHPTRLVPDRAPDVAVPVWHLLLLSPGGAGVPAVLLTTGLVVAGLAGTVREARRHVSLTAWAVVLVVLAWAAALSHLRAHGVLVWTAVPLQIAALGVLTAALVAANGVRARLEATSFGGRQLVAGLLALTAGLLPVVTGLLWLHRGADGPLTRSAPTVLPAFAQADLAVRPGLRALVLDPAGGPSRAVLSYDLLDAAGARLELAATPVGSDQREALDGVVADLASARGSDAALTLSTRAVRYVALRHPTAALVAVLDAQPGLVRRTSGPVPLWQVSAPTNRLTLLPARLGRTAVGPVRAPSEEALVLEPPVALPAGRRDAATRLVPGRGSRVVVLADASDPRWQLRVDGRLMREQTAWGWAASWSVPSQGGHLTLTYDDSARHHALVGELVAVLVLGVLAAPGGRRRRALDDDPVAS